MPPGTPVCQAILTFVPFEFDGEFGIVRAVARGVVVVSWATTRRGAVGDAGYSRSPARIVEAVDRLV